MKFAIGYGGNDHLDEDTLLVGEDGVVNQLDIYCPALPDGFKTERITYRLDEAHQAVVTVVEINSLEHLLELSRKMGRDISLDRQPQEMLDTVGAKLPEFCIIINEPEPQ